MQWCDSAWSNAVVNLVGCARVSANTSDCLARCRRYQMWHFARRAAKARVRSAHWSYVLCIRTFFAMKQFEQSVPAAHFASCGSSQKVVMYRFTARTHYRSRGCLRYSRWPIDVGGQVVARRKTESCTYAWRFSWRNARNACTCNMKQTLEALKTDEYTEQIRRTQSS